MADILVNSNVPADWRAAFAIATRTAAGNPETCEVEAVSSIPLVSDAISHNGFHLRERCPIFLYKPKGTACRCATRAHKSIGWRGILSQQTRLIPSSHSIEG